MKHPYHHGNLRAALLVAAEELLSEVGIEYFSLREVARRAGVSPGAPKHHFADARALFTAIAARAFDELANALEDAGSLTRANRERRIRAQGVAYVNFALAHRARFNLMWRKALLNKEDPAYELASQRAFSAIDRLVRGEDAPITSKSDRVLAPTIACWSLVHGFAVLAIDGTFGEVDISSYAIEAQVSAILKTLCL